MPTRNEIDLVGKTMRVMEILAESQGSANLKEIASQVGLVKSSVFRILYSLEKLGYAEHAAAKGSYQLTWKTLGLARRFASRATLPNVSRPHLVRLRDELSESTWLAEWRSRTAVLVDVAEAPQRLQLSLDVGGICPLHATAAGKAIAAHLPPAELRAALGSGKLPRFTRRTVASRAQLAIELDKVRREGYGINDEETIEGVVLIGAPVFDSMHRVCAAISVSIPTARWPAEKRERTIGSVKRAAARITTDLESLGWQPIRNAQPGG